MLITLVSDSASAFSLPILVVSKDAVGDKDDERRSVSRSERKLKMMAIVS